MWSIYTCYWLLFFQNDNLKYTWMFRKRSLNSFSLFCFLFFFYSFLFFNYLFSNSYAQKTSLIYIVYRILLRFCYVMYYIVSEIYIGRRFLEGCFYYYSQKTMFAVAKESLIPYKPAQGAAKTQTFDTCNTECHPKPNQTNIKFGSAF